MEKSAVGKRGERFELVVEHGKIREFARAVKTDHPRYQGEGPVIPPTYLTTTFHWVQDVAGADLWSSLKVDQTRGLHAEQEYVFFGPPPSAGTRLYCQSRIEQVYEKQGRRGGALTFGVMVTEFRDGAGKLVAEARMTGVETARNPEAG